MNSPNQITNGSTILLRFSDILRPQVLALLKQTVEPWLEELPVHLIQACDVLPDGQQQAYLDIMVILQQGQQQIAAQLTPLFNQSWRQFQQLVQPKNNVATESVSLDAMTLMDSEELELTVVMDSLSTRLAQQADGILLESFHRLQAVLPELKQIEQLPYYPIKLLQLITDLFQDAGLTLVQKMIITKQFAAVFDMKQLIPLIEQAMLQAQVPFIAPIVRVESEAFKAEDKPELVDVLRDIRDLNQKNTHGGMGNGVGSTVSELNTDPSSPLLQTTNSGGVVVDPARLVAQSAFFAQISQSVANVPLMPQNAYPLAQEQTVATLELMTRLSKLQESQPLTPISHGTEIQSVAEVRENIRDQLKNDEDTVEVIGKKDTDIINLVSALFDYILDDEDLPTAMKALLGRLQIPMLKVALLDENFFKTEKHPARLLLNSLAKAGVSWDEKSQSSDVLYKKIEETVFGLLTHFSNDIGLFDALLKDFNAFYDEQQVKIAIVDQRTREAEERRAKAEQARSEVQAILNQKLTGRRLPLSVIRLVQEGWRNVLYLSFLKDGKDAESWRQAVKVIDALIWSMMPVKADQAWLERLKSVAPKLVNSLRKGLASVNFDQIRADSLVHEIERIHQQTIDGLTPAVVEILTENNDTQADGKDRMGVEQALRMPEQQVKSVVLPKSDMVDLYQGETLPVTDRNVQTVKQIKVGAWIEFVKTDQRERHKLVARIRTMEKLIFANRRGIKVAEMSQMHLAVEFSQGRARLVDDQPQIIDRALQSVVGGLRQLTA